MQLIRFALLFNAFALVLLRILGIGIGLAQAQSPSLRSMSGSVLIEEGRDVYRGACAPCHGIRGDGRGPAASGMEPRPRDFTTGVFKFRSTPSGALPTDQDVFEIVSSGVPGTWMPAWDELLNDRQRWAVVEFLKTLMPESAIAFPGEGPMALSTQPSPDASTDEGRGVYMALECFKCHGTRGRGDGISAKSLTDDWGHPIKPYDFTRGHLKNGSGPEDLYRTLRTGLNGTPMPAYEPAVILFPGGSEVDLTAQATSYSDEDLSTLKTYLANQPDRARLGTMKESERNRIVERRLWSLVAYIESLSRDRGLAYQLFGEDPNVTPAPRSP